MDLGRLISVGVANVCQGRFFEPLRSDSTPLNGGYRVQMVKEVHLLGDKKHPGKHNIEKCYRWQIGHHHEATDEEPTFSCREPGKACADGILLCTGHELEEQTARTPACW